MEENNVTYMNFLCYLEYNLYYFAVMSTENCMTENIPISERLTLKLVKS